ncbi:hypothetical protein JCM8547_004599 [Rhodosporidiobolus lusitaniae]
MPPQPEGLETLLALGVDKQKALYALGEFRDKGGLDAAADWCFTDGATWTPASLLFPTFAPAPSSTARRSPSPPRDRFSSSSRSADHPPGWKPVPHRLLVPGTRVSITLKQDQGTGRTVEGTVSDRLTKADHPRGVKVRLADGRVGRVVRIL